MCGSFCVALVGVWLIPAGIYLLWWNESNYVCTDNSYEKAAENVVELPTTKTGLGTDPFSPVCDPTDVRGSFVHLECPVDVDELATAEESFGIVADGAYELSFETEQFAYERRSDTYSEYVNGNKKSRTCYCYVKKWTSTPVTSRSGETCDSCDTWGVDFPPKPDGDDPSTGLGTFNRYAEKVVMGKGAFVVDHDEVTNIAFAPVIPLEGTVPQTTPSGFVRTTANCGADKTCYYKSACYAVAAAVPGSPSSPCLGDVRASIVAHGSEDLSLIGRVSATGGPPAELVSQDFGGSFIPPCKSRSIFYVSDGLKSSETLFNELHTALSTLTTVLRFVSFFAVLFGFCMALYPFEALVEIVPFLGQFLGPMVGCVLGVFSFVAALAVWSCVFSVAWVFYRPVVGIPLLILSLGCAYAAVGMQRKALEKKRARLAAQQQQAAAAAYSEEAPSLKYGSGNDSVPLVQAQPI